MCASLNNVRDAVLAPGPPGRPGVDPKMEVLCFLQAEKVSVHRQLFLWTVQGGFLASSFTEATRPRSRTQVLELGVLPPARRTALDKLLYLSGPHFPHLENKHSSYLKELS